MREPIEFEPVAVERVWGGRSLEKLFGKVLPPGEPIGETWEMVDRQEVQSVVHRGVFKGKTLHKLWKNHRAEVFGKDYLEHASPRFPLLIKLLDARETLSVQVHPPSQVAAALGGEPKTEMWYFLHCKPGALIYAGLRAGVTCGEFEAAIQNGAVEKKLCALPVVEKGAILIPSGRLHAIGGGNILVEIQQNSDTTYRVFDWNRRGLDGQPRQLHIEESMASIDFKDHEPRLVPPGEPVPAECPYFKVDKLTVGGATQLALRGRFAVFCPVSGGVTINGRALRPAWFALAPAADAVELDAPAGPAEVLRISIPAR